jgi:hypothetical protein
MNCLTVNTRVFVCVRAARDLRWKNTDVSTEIAHRARQGKSACVFTRQVEVLTLGTQIPQPSSCYCTKYHTLRSESRCALRSVGCDI